ncbi:MAG: hypothetical protein AAF921_15370, partial [Cyanobacteria bacterium P01_D01_bin.44]
LVAGAGFEPTTFGLCLPLQFSLPEISLWPGLSLYPQLYLLGYLPTSLYTFSSRSLARDYRANGFPEFDR